MIILISITQSSPSEPADPGKVPRMIEAHPPRITTQEAAKDWRKILEKLQRQQFREARAKLAEWEAEHGETEETRSLANQLDAVLRAQVRSRGY